MRPYICLLAALACIAPARAETGLASWYGLHWHGRLRADGHPFNAYGDNAASRVYPLGTRLIVTNLANGRQTEVTVLDRGPYVGHRVIDLSLGTARVLGFEHQGLAHVRIEPEGVVVRPAVYRWRVKPHHRHCHEHR